jgi:hypothetical protein
MAGQGVQFPAAFLGAKLSNSEAAFDFFRDTDTEPFFLFSVCELTTEPPTACFMEHEPEASF